jgi:hypothetical protein
LHHKKSKNIYLGVPIVDAHETETVQNWVGFACHDSCSNMPSSEVQSAFESTSTILIDYDVPVKEDCHKIHLKKTLNWPSYCGTRWEKIEDILVNNATQLKEMSHRQKWSNTLEFFRWRKLIYDKTRIKVNLNVPIP